MGEAIDRYWGRLIRTSEWYVPRHMTRPSVYTHPRNVRDSLLAIHFSPLGSVMDERKALAIEFFSDYPEADVAPEVFLKSEDED